MGLGIEILDLTFPRWQGTSWVGESQEPYGDQHSRPFHGGKVNQGRRQLLRGVGRNIRSVYEPMEEEGESDDG